MLEVKLLIAVRATNVMKGTTVFLKPQNGVEKAVALTAERVARGTVVVCSAPKTRKQWGAVTAGGIPGSD